MGACCSEEPSERQLILNSKPAPVTNYGSAATHEQRAAYNDYVKEKKRWNRRVDDYNVKCDRLRRQYLLERQHQIRNPQNIPNITDTSNLMNGYLVHRNQ